MAPFFALLRKSKSIFPSFILFHRKNAFGFTFVEVMVTLVILSTGIAVIFRAFFYSLDQMRYVTHRLMANVYADNRISEIERILKAYNALPFDDRRIYVWQEGSKKTEYREELKFKEIDNFPDVFSMELILTWQEGKKTVRLIKEAYILDLYTRKNEN